MNIVFDIETPSSLTATGIPTEPAIVLAEDDTDHRSHSRSRTRERQTARRWKKTEGSRWNDRTNKSARFAR